MRQQHFFYMIGYLEGTALSSKIVKTSGGVGYVVQCPIELVAKNTVSLFITTIVRENAITLYGFESEKEQTLFNTLLNVQGVGPAAGLALLRDVGFNKIIPAVQQNDYKALIKANGIGKTVAEKICALIKLPAELTSNFSEVEETSNMVKELVTTLEMLGYDSEKAEKAAKNAFLQNSEGDEETLISAALAEITTK